MHHSCKYTSTVGIVTIVTISTTTTAVPPAVIVPMPVITITQSRSSGLDQEKLC